MKNVFKSFDGKYFDDYEDCVNYEFNKLKIVTFYDEKIVPIDISMFDSYDNIYIPSEEAKNCLQAFLEESDDVFLDNDIFECGFNIWDEYSDGWMKIPDKVVKFIRSI